VTKRAEKWPVIG